MDLKNSLSYWNESPQVAIVLETIVHKLPLWIQYLYFGPILVNKQKKSVFVEELIVVSYLFMCSNNNFQATFYFYKLSNLKQMLIEATVSLHLKCLRKFIE